MDAFTIPAGYVVADDLRSLIESVLAADDASQETVRRAISTA